MNADKEYIDLLAELDLGENWAPRCKRTLEIRGRQSRVNMQEPVIWNPARKLNYKFMLSEALWVLSGSNQLRFNQTIEKIWTPYSNDGVTLDGAYGPMVSGQLRYVIDTLHEDPSSRQAVISIWRPNPRKSKDVPCTLTLQFLIRWPSIHCIASMRSSDAWLGWPYDVFVFSMIANYIAIAYNQDLEPDIKIDLGMLTLTAGSQHIYEEHFDLARTLPRYNGEVCGISTHDFNTPDDLMNQLRCAIDGPIAQISSPLLVKLNGLANKK